MVPGTNSIGLEEDGAKDQMEKTPLQLDRAEESIGLSHQIHLVPKKADVVQFS